MYGKIYEKLNRFDHAIRYFILKEKTLKKIIDTSDNNLNYINLFNTYLKLGKLHQKISQYNISNNYFLKCLNLSYKLYDKRKTALALKLIAENYYNQNNYNQALSNYLYSLKNYQKLNDLINQINILFQITQIYFYQGDYLKAFDTYFQIANISKDNYPIFYALSYIKMAELLSELELIKEAQKYLDLVKEITEKKDSILKIKANIVQSKIHLKEKNYKKAKQLLLSTLKLTPTNNYLLQADIHDLIGLTELETKNYNSAIKHLTACYKLREKNKNNLYNAISYLHLGQYYLTIKNYKQAENYLKNSFSYFNKINNLHFLLKNNLLLSDIYKETKNYELAHKYLNNYINIENFIIKKSQLEILNKIEKKSKEVYEEKLKQEKIEYTKKYNKILKVFLILFLLFLIFLLYQSIKLKNKNKLLSSQRKTLIKAYQILNKRYIQYKRFYLAANLSSNSIFATSPNGTLLWFNKACKKLYNLNNDTIGKNIKNLSTYKNIDKVYSLLNKKKTVRYLNYHLKNDKKIWLQTTMSPLIRNDKVYEIIAIEHDITYYMLKSKKIKKQQIFHYKKHQILNKQKKKLLQQQEELKTTTEKLNNIIKKQLQLLTAIKSSDNFIFFLNKNNEITWANKTNFNINNLNNSRTLPQQLNDLLIKNPKFKLHIDKVKKEKKPLSFLCQQNINNKTIWLQTTISPVLDSNNNIETLVIIQTDITKLKEIEEDLTIKNKEIIDSILYAKRIQMALLPMKIFLQALFYNNYFIYLEPRDIVSGDFYWASVHKNKILFAIADSTGHGIPGAFMSVIGILALNEVSKKLKNINTSNFLYELKETISLILRQQGKKGEPNDSIDIAFCIFDFNKKTLEFTGAYIPLYIARKKNNKVNIITLPANNYTIGYDQHKNTNLKSYSVQLQNNDMIYISTDGFIDQFGGSNNKKFKKGRFLNLLKKLYNLPIKEQYTTIKQEFLNWKGNNPQIDDILVFGLRIDKNLS